MWEDVYVHETAVCTACEARFPRTNRTGVAPKRCPVCEREHQRLRSIEKRRRARERMLSSMGLHTKIRILDCAICKRTWVCERINSGALPMFCSEDCRRVGRRKVGQRYAASPEGRKKKAAQIARARRQRFGTCLHCGSSFPIQLGWRGTPTYCSPDCRRTALLIRKRCAEAERRALKLDAPEIERFTLDEIYARDKAICHLCSGHCLRRDATVDHLIPLIKGGPHTRANVKLAHRSCNSRKKDRLLHELPWYQPEQERGKRTE